MTPQQTIERYFEALGWKFSGSFSDNWNTFCWWFNNERMTNHLPNILEHYPSFKKHVIEEMERRGLKLSVSVCGGMGEIQLVSWDNDLGRAASESIEVKDNEITLAAVEAACELLEKEKEDDRMS